MYKKFSLAVVLAILLALSLVAVASAVTITVDGSRADWNTPIGDGVPGVADDVNEAGITDGYDVEQLLWTNDRAYFYFGVQTYANSIWTGTPIPTMVICIDTDNSASTGGSYANCNGMTGIDRSVVVIRGIGSNLLVDVLDSDPNTGSSVATDTAGFRQTNFNEFRIALSDLGFSESNCRSDMRAVVYFDNGVVDPDDNNPDTGIFTLTCGTPTSITLVDASANNGVSMAVVLGGILVAAAGVIVWRMRK